MTPLELQDWLLDDGIKEDLKHLTRWTVLTEIDNLSTPLDFTANFDWERVLLAGSILARSNDRRHEEAALRIATAAVTLETPTPVREAGAVLLEKLSNHRAVDLAHERSRIEEGSRSRLGVSMRLEAQRRQLENAVLVEASGSWMQVNAFQRQFWSGATGKSTWLSASAPTASGKTYLVLQWLADQMRCTTAKTAIYLAPTRALVSEIEENFRSILAEADQIDVTSLPLRDKYDVASAGGKKAVLVFTQERLHLLLNILDDNANIDVLVVDEAHKIGDHQRGVILQDAIERLNRINPNLKVVFISPATQNPAALLEDAPEDADKLSIDSDNPTVLQNILLAEQMPRKPKQWRISLRSGEAVEELGILNLSSKPAGLRKQLAFIAAAAGERGGTLIYTNRPSDAEAVASLISQLAASSKTTDPELLDLADLARKGVHKNYLLAPLVERGVAFHYGNMPSLIRLEVERLFRDGKIKFLACTSTLIEGVNLSCRTIVVRGPRKGQGRPMEPHDFWNLAGRAGRWGNEFQGNIICIDPHDKEAWPTGVPSRARYPIRRETDAVISKATDLVAFLANREIATPKELAEADQFEQVSAYLLASYLRLGSISDAPFSKRHEPAILKQIDDSLAKVAGNIDIAPSVVARHPGVSAIGLQKLLNSFRTYDADVENLLPAPIESFDSYDRFVAIMERINENIFPTPHPEVVRLHILVVVEWLKGLSLASIIKNRIEWQEKNEKDYKLPDLIRSTMEIVEQTARFRAPKYMSAYFDVLKVFLREVGREDLIDEELDIGVALEFGVSTRTLLSLIELGLSRMSAVALYEKIAKDDLDKEGCQAWVIEHSEALKAMDLPMLILREIQLKFRADDTGSEEVLVQV